MYQLLKEKTIYLEQGLRQVFETKNIPITINRCGSMISIHFTSQPVNNFSAAAGANNEVFNSSFHHLLDHGIYLPPSAFETWFVSHALSKEDLDATLETVSTFSL